MNNVVWYLSAFLIASFFIYYLLLKNKDRFLYLIAPVSIVIILAFCYHDMGYLGYSNQYQFLLCTGVWEAFASLAYGCICYKIYKTLNEKWAPLFKKKGIRVAATVFEVLGFGFFLYYSWYGCTEKDFIVLFLIGLLLVSVFTRSSYLTQMLDHKLFGYLGKISFAIYLNQFIIIHLFEKKFQGYPFWPAAIVMLILVVVFSMFSTWLVDKIVIKLRKTVSKIVL